MRRLLGRAIPLALAAACHHATGAVRQQATSADAQLTAATRHYAELLRGAPADSVAAMYAPAGALVLPGRDPLRGRDAIREFLAPLAGATSVPLVEMMIDSLSVNGSVATTAGTYRQLAGPKGATPDQLREYRGRYHASWERQPDGAWRFVELVMIPASKD